MKKLLHLLICSLFINTALASTLHTQIDRTTVSADQVLHLTLIIEGHRPHGQLDMSPIEKDFDIISVAQSSRMMVINGKSSQRFAVTLTLKPKSTGKIIIPALTWDGATSKPLTVTSTFAAAKPAATKAAMKSSEQPTLSLQLDTKTPYVKGPVHVTLVAQAPGPIYQAQVTHLGVGNDTPLGRLDTNTPTKTDSHTFKKSFIFFPQTPGNMQLGLVRVIGYYKNQGPLGTQLIPFEVTTKAPVQLQVKNKPKQAEGWWLPAKKVTLTETLTPTKSEYVAGQPITRTLTLQVEGNIAQQLPSLDQADVPGLKHYADAPFKDNRVEKSGLLAILKQKITLIPTAGKNLTLPEIDIPWWNLSTQKTEIVRLPAHTLHIVGGGVLHTASTNTVNTAVKNAEPAAREAVAVEKPSVGPANTVVQTFAHLTHAWHSAATGTAGFAVLLSVGCLGWRRILARITQYNALRKLKKYCVAQDAGQVRQQLRVWAQTVWPEISFTDASAVIVQLDDETLAEQFASLEQQVFSAHSRGWDGAAFWMAFQSARKAYQKRDATKRQVRDLLPRL